LLTSYRQGLSLQDINNLPTAFIDDQYIQIGKNVKRIRNEKGISQLKLSTAMGYKSVAIVSHAEICLNGKHFNIEHLLKIAYILDTDICLFFKTASK